jgi:6-pyruvoyltetrahydropterin/6-carboxytetrahydropterin synthase
MLSKHPGRCRFPHGHSRVVTLVVSGSRLDRNDMVCDFKALKLALERACDRFDHAMVINSEDPIAGQLGESVERTVLFESEDPTTEVLARRIYESLRRIILEGEPLRDEEGISYCLPRDLVIERVRVTETDCTWAEYVP